MAKRGRKKLERRVNYGAADIKLAYQKYVRRQNRLGREVEYTYEQFEANVYDRQYKYGVKKYTIKQGIKIFMHSRAIMSYSDIARENMINAIKTKFPDVYKRIQALTGDRSAEGKIVPMYEKLQWDEDFNAYTFNDKDGNKYVIITTNSPQEIYFERV